MMLDYTEKDTSKCAVVSNVNNGEREREREKRREEKRDDALHTYMLKESLSPWYFTVRLSDLTVAGLSRWRVVLAEQYDDVRPQLLPSEVEQMDTFAKALLRQIEVLSRCLYSSFVRHCTS